ncbi:uncharacterized protein [Rutidosis leptorrhynchoides]|uniref:uncharacterized protein n=1 Tax=Rutidosis leptorrhynchoides TaxID=125765 RepID=UPI003A997064
MPNRALHYIIKLSSIIRQVISSISGIIMQSPDTVCDEIMDSKKEDSTQGRLKEDIEKHPKITQWFPVLKRKTPETLSARRHSIPEIRECPSSDNNNNNKKLKFESYVFNTLFEKARENEEIITARHPEKKSRDVGDLTGCVVEGAEGTRWCLKFDSVSASKRCEKLYDKALGELIYETNGKTLLERAVDEYCPFHVELWIALAWLENYPDGAKSVLKKAHEKLPTHVQPALWTAEAKLEEAYNGNTDMVSKMIRMGINDLLHQHVVFDRKAWIKEAEAAERSGFVKTCNAVIDRTVKYGVKYQDQELTMLGDAQECKKRGSFETARAIYRVLTNTFGYDENLWIKAAQLEKDDGKLDLFDALLCKAVKRKPKSEVLWLMRANEKRFAGDLEAARKILEEAYAELPDSEEIWHAAFKLEYDNKELERARTFLAKLSANGGGTERMWMKSAIVERELHNVEGERRLINEGLKLFPWFFKLWLMLGQLEERLDRLGEAKDAYESGVRHCPNSTPLWLSLANIEERTSEYSRVKDVLKKARKRNPKNPELWVASVRAELRHGSIFQAQELYSMATDECGDNIGILWVASIELAPIQQRYHVSHDIALKKCGDDPHIMAVIGKICWENKNVDEARSWLNRAVTVAPDVGDFWGLLYRFELQHGTEDQQKEVLRKCIDAGPKHGDKWQPISKALENSHEPVEAILVKLVHALGQQEKLPLQQHL